MGPRLGAESEDAVGTCSRCGVTYAGRRDDRGRLTLMLAAHERLCPGGSRSGETVTPLGKSAASAPAKRGPELRGLPGGKKR